MTGYPQRSRPRMAFTVWLAVSLSILLPASMALAQGGGPSVIVRVTIEQVVTLNQCPDSCGGPWTPADFFARVTIDGETTRFDEISNDNSIEPDWRCSSARIPVSRGSVPVTVKIWDEDPSPNDDDPYDINDKTEIESMPGDDLELTIDLLPCSITSETPIRAPGEQSFSNTWTCGDSFLSGTARTGPDNDANAYVVAKVEVFDPGVRCLHRPIWPAPGASVTITAEAPAGSVDPNDSIEIWVDDRTQPLKVDSGLSTSVTVGPLNADSFHYNCRIIDDGIPVATGWRLVSVGTTLSDAYQNSVPVYYSGHRRDSLDVLFHAEDVSYPSGPDSAPFLADVYDMIWNGFFAEEIFLQNQEKFNFWIARDAAHVVLEPDPPGPDLCTVPAGTNARAWGDLPLVLHRAACRDSMFNSSWASQATTETGQADSHRVVVHEASHGLFNLSDEYPLDGGYFEASPMPNVYNSKVYCERDAEDYYTLRETWGDGFCEQKENVLRIGRAPACRQFQGQGRTRYTSDPNSNDLMRDSGRPQLLDLRRIDWQFCKCRRGNC